jgi:hypothetical protein
MAESEIQWEAPEFEHRERDVSWYWISIIIAAAIIAFAIWQRNFLFGLFVVIAEILVIIWGNQTPRMIAFVLTEKGVEIEPGKFHRFSDMESFSIDKSSDDEPWGVIIFHHHGKFKLPLIIKLPKEKLEEIKNNIKKILKETDYEPSFLDSLEKLIGF